MYTLLKPFLVRETLLEKGIKIFTLLEFGRVFEIPPFKAKRYLNRWAKEDFVVRLKRGLYVLKSDMPSEEEIANRLYRPSYLSFEYALAFHNILPEMPYEITSATTISSRNFTIGSKVFSFFKIKLKAYTGYGLNKIGEKYFLIAEPEKALVDYLYFVVLGKKPFNERLNLENLNKEKILEYAALFDRPQLNRLIKEKL